ncbi:MAG: flagellar hook assembly protein FlgD [Alphaproteobacteria bacterium]|nr:flagellar hook assembly protein FlgD [Alphaproteobacteria bacterium]MBF0249259.1 flagellar hook assembly protein FlgD [Alphaproteobacteria bacterium]
MALFGGLSDVASIDTSTKAGQSQQKLQDDLNQFLNLLVAQLQNQDPLEPLDANEFTSQLVQFASVEQQIQQNAHLEKMLNLQQTSQVGSMVNYLGTVIESLGQDFAVENGTGKFTYTLDASAREGTITIRNASGLTVWNGSAETEAGQHTFVWDGVMNNGQQAPDGAYQVIVSAQDNFGDLMDVKHTVFGRVTGAGAEGGNVTLNMGDIEVDMDDILAVQEAPSVQ